MSMVLPSDIMKRLNLLIPKAHQTEFVSQTLSRALDEKEVALQPSLFDAGDQPTFSLYSDGGARGNPGIAGCGAVIFDDKGKEVKRLKKYLGETTNNQAEYYGLIIGLEEIAKNMKVSSLVCYADSQLLIKQLNGEYKVKDANIAERVSEIQVLLQKIPSVQFKYIPREKNKIADSLANKAMDEKK